MIGFWRKHFLRAELVLAVVLTAALVAWSERGGAQVLDTVLPQDRGAFYGAIAAVFGSLLGFAITAASVVVALSGSDGLRPVRESPYYRDLWDVFVSAMQVLGIATVVSLGALLLDRGPALNYLVLYAVAFVTLLSTLRVARCIWVMENIIRIVARA